MPSKLADSVRTIETRLRSESEAAPLLTTAAVQGALAHAFAAAWPPSRLSLASGLELFRSLCVRIVQRATSDNKDACELVAELLDAAQRYAQAAETSRARIAQRVLQFISDKVSITTYGHSGAIVASIREAIAHGRVVRIALVAPGPDDEETRRALSAFTEIGAAVTVCPAFDALAAVQQTTFVLVGAECVARNGAVINRCGTAQLAHLARTFNKPLYVVAESTKFLNSFVLDRADLQGVLGARALPWAFDAVNERYARALGRDPGALQLDVTPPELVDLLLTDIGVMPPSTAAEEISRSM